MAFARNASMDFTRPTTFVILAMLAAPPARIPPTASPASQDTIGAYQTEDYVRHVPADVLLATPQEPALVVWQTTIFSSQTVWPAQPTVTNALMVRPALHAQQAS